MNRKVFWIGLLSAIGLGAQQHGATSPSKNVAFSIKPRPNECPVCGTFAKQWHKVGIDCFGYPGGSGCQDMNLVRCKFCNAAFWQDAQ